MIQETMEVQELSLEKVMETKLVQNNITERVLAELKEKYGNLKLAAVDDKESYLEVKAAARDCAKVRNLAIRVCKEGRDEAVKIQKQWVAKEKEVVAKVAEVEGPLDAEIAKFDAEVERKANEEKERRESAYINRQATLTKMGATYVNGSFVLGEASYEAILIKECADDIWEESVVPSFRKEYEILESAKAEEEKKKAAAAAELKRQQEEFQREQEAFKAQQAEFEAQKREAAARQAEESRKKMQIRAMQLESLGMKFSFQYDAYLYEDVNVDNKTEISLLADNEWDALVEKIKPVIEQRKEEAAKRAYEKRQEEIRLAAEEATRKEQERQAELQKQAELQRQQEEAKKAEELAQSTDKVKYDDLISKLKAIHLPEMRSGQYRKKVQIAREKIGEILAQ